MQVVGVVEGTSCPSDQLVLMTCEDEKLFAYDGEELHSVASSMKKLLEEGISYPGSKTYYEGEAFKDKIKEDWEEVRNRPTGKKLEQEHLKLLTENKDTFMECLKATAAIKECPSQKPVASPRVLVSRAEELYERKNPLRRNAQAIIQKMLELNHSSENQTTQLVDEILHIIFFLGRVNTPPFSPEEIVNDEEMLEKLKDCYPLPFELYSSKLPRRSPFSCVLDMIVFLEGQEKEDEIIRRLQEIIKPLNQDHLVPYTICVSQIKNNQNSACRYYGVSMSKMLPDVHRIMISASCLEYWHSDVAGAVMTYHPNDTKHLDFDGVITLPEKVTCETFNLFTGERVYMPDTHLAEGASAKSQIAARSSLTCSTSTPSPPDTDRPKTFALGNCAEAESLSNLFKKDSEVRRQAPPTSEMGTDDNRKMAAERLRKDLRKCLKEKHGFTWDNTFYKPQL